MRNKTPWEATYWRPEPLWAGQTVFLLAGGPSLADVNLSVLRGRNVMAITSSAFAAREAGLDGEALCFMDNGWWSHHRELCEAWRGPIYTLSRMAKREAPELVRRVEMASPHPEFPAAGAPVIRWGRSSGHVAVSIAVACGAKRIVLLGYDMRVVEGRSHHHADYSRPGHPDVYAEFVRYFDGWDAAAARAGVTILNATPDSALKEFEMVDLADVLRHRVRRKPVQDVAPLVDETEADV